MLLLKCKLFRNVSTAAEMHLLSMLSSPQHTGISVPFYTCTNATGHHSQLLFVFSLVSFHTILLESKNISHAIDPKLPVISIDLNKTGIISVSLF